MFPSSFCPRHMEGSGIFLGFLRILIKGKRKKKGKFRENKRESVEKEERNDFGRKG